MIIWKGIGIGVAFIAALFIFLTQYIVPENTDFKIQMGLGMVLAGLFWWLSMKRKEAQEKKIMESGNEKQKAALEKRNEIPGMANLSESSLFFIPVTYWHYVLVVGGIVLMVAGLIN